MSNFDLIDDYLANRLSGDEIKTFEGDMIGDPTLRSEVERQRIIIEGIRKARIGELKSMLNQVPIEGGAVLGNWSAMKVAATIGVAAIIGTGIYFYLNSSTPSIPVTPSVEIPSDSISPEETPEQPIVETKEGANTETKESAKPKVEKKAEQKNESSIVNTTKVEIADPTEEMIADEPIDSESINLKSTITPSAIQVKTDKTNNLYSFHYQFWEGKLFLYGPFDEALYEILEVHGDRHALFLVFKGNYYLLDESKEDVTELTPIRDRPLIQLLKEYKSDQ